MPNLGIAVTSLVEMVMRTTSLLKTLVLSVKKGTQQAINNLLKVHPNQTWLSSVTFIDSRGWLQNHRLENSIFCYQTDKPIFVRLRVYLILLIVPACLFLKGYFVTGRWNSGDPYNARATSRIKSTRRGFWAIPEKAFALLSLSVQIFSCCRVCFHSCQYRLVMVAMFPILLEYDDGSHVLTEWCAI